MRPLRLVLVLALLGVGCSRTPKRLRTDDEKAEIQEQLEELKRQAEEDDEELFNRVTTAHRTARIDGETACPVEREEIVGGNPPAYVATEMRINRPNLYHGPNSQAAAEASAGLEVTLDDEFEGKDPFAELRKAQERYQTFAARRYRLVFLIEEIVAPKLVAEDLFEPGVVSGALYVWDVEGRALVCGARVLATNNDRVRVEQTTFGSSPAPIPDILKDVGLSDDLKKNAIETGFGELKAIAPDPT